LTCNHEVTGSIPVPGSAKHQFERLVRSVLLGGPSIRPMVADYIGSVSRAALVVGGTGPTGPHVVGGLVERGFAVTMLHTGRHERDEIPDVVEHVHTDPFDALAVDDAPGGRTFDVAALMYGRLRDLAPVLARRAAKLVSVGGMPAVLGYGDPEALTPAGLPVPTREASAVVAGPDAAAARWGASSSRRTRCSPLRRRRPTSVTRSCTGPTSSCRGSG
jgi:hypothetical protein